ncbi:MAG: GNAT family N-acetyltransferase, partial [Acidobacteria bacterium]|nr:GNAT family N-acetyltransferase [Acidobacteriota bacterium]
MNASSDDRTVTIRTELRPGDLGWVIYRHGRLYSAENGYGLEFEAYVAAGLAEFYRAYDPASDRVWVCETSAGIVGFMLLMHRPETTAQLRYFYLEPEFRGRGLGGRLMRLFMEFLHEKNYRAAYLWTTEEQLAAAALYERHGFKLTEEKRSEAFGKPLTERRYDWKSGKVEK